MPKKIEPAFYFIGNHPVLDFINTKIVASGKMVDLLDRFDSLLDWFVKAELISQEKAEEHARRWGSSEAGEQTVEAARQFRGILLSLLQSCKLHEPIRIEQLEAINALLKERAVTTKLVYTEQGFVKVQQRKIGEPQDLLSLLAEAAVDFFSQHDLNLIKKCENPQCVLYFYDNSKNSTRRWCSPKTCGNRMKVAAFLERKRNSKES